ncbi:hypothetical protein EGM51_12890 [Verrucomicrobia bacterium S94]|nr:hypothetical protein EGM51_12890 [Verrucomicrobia bacterium S94]
MKKIITTTIATGLVAGVASAGVSTTFDFASAYVFRGTTLNEGAVFQPGIEASGYGLPEEYGSVTFGAWANWDLDDNDGAASTSEFSETDWYVSYSLPAFVDGLDLFIGYCDYSYGGTSDKEFNVGAGYEIAGVGLGLTGYFMSGGAYSGQNYYEFTAGYGIDITDELSGSVDASVGYILQSDKPASAGLDDGLNDASIGASLGYALGETWSVGASLTYITNFDDDVLPDATGAYDVSVVGMLSLAAEM